MFFIVNKIDNNGNNNDRNSHRRCSVQESVLKIFARKTPVLESLFNKVVGFQACHVKKDTPTQALFCEICEIFKNTYFEEHSRTTASVMITIKASQKQLKGSFVFKQKFHALRF